MSHVEGNVAAGRYITNGAEGLNKLEKIYKGNTIEKLTITKSVIGGGAGTFNFVLTSKDNWNSTQSNTDMTRIPFTITIEEGETSNSIDLVADDSELKEVILAALYDGPLYLFELDDSGNPIVNGGTYNTSTSETPITYQVRYTTSDGSLHEESNQITSTALKNLLGTFELGDAVMDASGTGRFVLDDNGHIVVNERNPKTAVLELKYFGPEGTMTYFDAANLDHAEWGGDGNDLVITMKDGTVITIQDFQNITH